jgi:hypothetical protein
MRVKCGTVAKRIAPWGVEGVDAAFETHGECFGDAANEWVCWVYDVATVMKVQYERKEGNVTKEGSV